MLPDVHSFCICYGTLFLPFSPPCRGALGVAGMVVSWVPHCHEARVESREAYHEDAKRCLKFAKIFGFLGFLDKVCEGDQLLVSFVGRYKKEWAPSHEALCQLKSVMKVLLKRALDQIKTWFPKSDTACKRRQIEVRNRPALWTHSAYFSHTKWRIDASFQDPNRQPFHRQKP